MTDTLSIKERSERMSLIRAKDTKPEIAVRKALFRMGYRYRLHLKKLPGCPDIVLASRKKIVFVHGCFWHRHKGCRYARLPKSKLEYWERKLQLNKMRDAKHQRELKKLGWSVLVIWECQQANEKRLTVLLQSFLES